MKKTIIALYGKSHIGKTSTIKKVDLLIQKKYPKAKINYKKPKIGDIKVVITIEKIKIGIESQGDPGSRLEESLHEFVSIGCDIIICATRTSGHNMNVVNSLRKKYDVIWTANYQSSEKDKDQLNDISAEHIFDLIKRVINGTL